MNGFSFSSRHESRITNHGFTLLELVVATFVIGVTVIGLFGLVLLTVRTAAEGERRIVATALANEKMELVRNLPYVQVGTAGGVPSGTLPQVETLVRNGISYTVRTDIRYVDDPYDGVAGGGGGGCTEISHRPPGQMGNCQDLCVSSESLNAHLAHGDSASEHCDGTPIVGPDSLNTDYKLVRIEASWESANQPSPVLLLSFVSPDGIEGGEEGGTLDFQALDAAGNGVVAAPVHVVNSTVDPPVDLTTQTNTEGRVVLPGLPPATGSYALTVGGGGYTTEQTYSTTADFIPNADHGHLSIIQGEVTPKTFFIDTVSSAALLFEEGGNIADGNECRAGLGGVGTPLADIAYTLQGTKTIGTDGTGNPVYLVEAAGVSDIQGEAEHNNLVWDQYDVVLDAVVGCDIAEASVPLPLSLAPGEGGALTVRLVAHTDFSVQVAVIDAAGAPIDNATVRLLGAGYDETLSTGAWGQVFFADLPGVGEYQLTVSAPGYGDSANTLSVEGSVRTQVSLGAL